MSGTPVSGSRPAIVGLYFDELALCPQSTEELSEIGERHSGIPHTLCVAAASKNNKYPVQPPAASDGPDGATESLRQFALAVYGAEGVPPACLALQDRLELDVNMLLFSAYVGAVRGQTLTTELVNTARALVDPWHTEVVRPLRAVRRRLKTGPAPAPDPGTDGLRRDISKAELDAEMIELEQLEGWANDLDALPALGDAAERATAAMTIAVSTYFSGTLDDEDRRALAVIAAAAARHSEVDR